MPIKVFIVLKILEIIKFLLGHNIAHSYADSLVPCPKLCCLQRPSARLLLSRKQKEALCKVYATNRYPDTSLRNKLSEELKLERIQVDHWFRNKRYYYDECSGEMACCM